MPIATCTRMPVRLRLPDFSFSGDSPVRAVKWDMAEVVAPGRAGGYRERSLEL